VGRSEVSAVIKCRFGSNEGCSRIEAGMGLGIVNVDINNVRVGLNLGVNVQNAIAMKLDPSRSALKQSA
jgi:hypothetical protein